MKGSSMRTKHPDVKCRNCQNLKTYKDPEGLLIRCGLGYYDHPSYVGSEKMIPVFYSVLSLKGGNVGIWKAMNKCGFNYQVAIQELAGKE